VALFFVPGGFTTITANGQSVTNSSGVNQASSNCGNVSQSSDGEGFGDSEELIDFLIKHGVPMMLDHGTPEIKETLIKLLIKSGKFGA
jgi:hypothetical protein